MYIEFAKDPYPIKAIMPVPGLIWLSLIEFNSFSTNVPLTDKPDNFYYQNVTLPHVFFKHFGGKTKNGSIFSHGINL